MIQIQTFRLEKKCNEFLESLKNNSFVDIKITEVFDEKDNILHTSYHVLYWKEK